MKIQSLTRLALLFAMTVILMVLEGFIPPIPALPPGVKLGLSNIALMYTLFFMGTKEGIILLSLKSLFVFLTRGLFAFFMSTAGGILSISVMILLLGLKKHKPSYIMTSMCAAVAHNIGQLITAGIIMKSYAVFFYLPVLLISGVIMGAITGTVLKVTLPAMKRLGIYNKSKA